MERRYAPLGIVKGYGDRLTTLEAAGSGYLPITGGTLTGALAINSVMSLDTAGSHITLRETDGADPADRAILEVNGSNFNIYTHDNSPGTWYLPLRASITSGEVWLGQSGTTTNIQGTAHVPNGTLNLGVVDTTTGGTLKIHGTTANKTAELICTNGNLHIDANDGQYIYLNYYSNTAGTYVSANGGFASTTQQTGEYGSVQTFGTKGGYGGYSLAGNFALMNSGSSHVGLYDDMNNEWMILAYPNSYLSLYYNGAQKLTTRAQGVSVSGSYMATPEGNLFGSDYIHYATPLPGGGLNNNGSSQTGYLRINMPTEGTSNMGGFTIRGYDYNQIKGGWAVRVDYYEYIDGNGFVNETARVLYGNPPFDIVRFGTATGSNGRYILCGTSTTAWAYAQICLTDFFVGYSGQSSHLTNANDWTVDISASTPTGWSQEYSSYIGGQIRYATGQSGMNLGGQVTVQSGGSASGGQNGDIVLIY